MTQKVTFFAVFHLWVIFCGLTCLKLVKKNKLHLVRYIWGLKITQNAKIENGEKVIFLGHFLVRRLTLDPIFGTQMCPYGPGHGKLLCQAGPGDYFGAFYGVYRPTIAEKYPKNHYFHKYSTLELNISLIVG